MADELKPEDAAPSDLTPEAFREAVDEIISMKERAREHNGEAGSFTKSFCEDHKLDKGAFTTITKLARKDRQQGQATMNAMVRYARMYGLFDQMDAFDDVVETMRAIVDEADSGASMQGGSAEYKQSEMAAQ